MCCDPAAFAPGRLRIAQAATAARGGRSGEGPQAARQAAARRRSDVVVKDATAFVITPDGAAWRQRRRDRPRHIRIRRRAGGCCGRAAGARRAAHGRRLMGVAVHAAAGRRSRPRPLWVSWPAICCGGCLSRWPPSTAADSSIVVERQLRLVDSLPPGAERPRGRADRSAERASLGAIGGPGPHLALKPADTAWRDPDRSGKVA